MSHDTELTAHYVLNVTTSCPGTITLEGSAKQTKFFSRYEGVLFEPEIIVDLLEARAVTDAIATKSVLECEKQGLFDFWETIFSTDEMTVGSDDYILAQGREVDMTELEEKESSGEDVSWEFYGQQGDDIEEIEVVEGPFITIAGAGLLGEKLTPKEILALLPQEQQEPNDQQKNQTPHERQSFWARLFGKGQ